MLSALRLWASWLTDGTNGVNAKLAYMAANGLIDGADPTPPDIAAIITQEDDVRMAFGEKGETWPALVLLDEDDGEFEGEVATSSRDGVVRLTALYVPRDAQAAGTYVASDYTRRAVIMSTEWWMKNASEPERTALATYVISAGGGDQPLALRRRSAQEFIRGIPHAGGLTYSLNVRDRHP